MSLSTLSGGSTTACAACKYQRKKCTKNCLLAPYFPQERQKQFQNAHKLFGVSNITKLLKGLEESQRDDAMRSLIYHADARALDPVGGVYRIISDLERKIECCRAELNLVNQQVSLCRSLAHLHQQQQQQQQQQRQEDLSYGCYSYGALLEQGDEYVNADGYDHQNMQRLQEMQQQQQNMLNYEMFMKKMPDQTSKVKLEKEKVSDSEVNNLLSQILMSS